MRFLGPTRRRLAFLLLVATTLVSLSLSSPARADRAASPGGKARSLAQVGYIYHGLAVQPPHTKGSMKGKVKMPLYNKYFLKTAVRQRAAIKFRDGTVLNMNQSTVAMLQSSHITNVNSGEVDEILAPGTNHKVKTATAIASAIGTNFDIKAVPGGAIFIVLHGALQVQNKRGSQIVKTNQQSIVLPGKAPQQPQHVNAAQAAGWTSSMPKANLGENQALDANGGHVVAFSSQYTSAAEGDLWDAKFINDGSTTTGWESASGDVTDQWVKLGFQGNKTYRIAKVIIDPAATQGDSPTADLKDFEIRVSTTGTDDSDFTTVLSQTCRQSNSLQEFDLPQPVDAKYIELYGTNNYGSPDWLAVAEFEAVSAPS